MTKRKHDYAREIELKSLLIRIKNKNLNIGEVKDNSVITKLLNRHSRVVNFKTTNSTKKKRIKDKLKKKIISLSEQTQIDKVSFEKFGFIILLMIKNILRKPQFSGYTYKDDFYSDSVHKIIKYLNNFDHTLISERTNISVNAFSYISQIIHNSVVYIIKKKKKENDDFKKYAAVEYSSVMKIKGFDWYINDELISSEELNIPTETPTEYYIEKIDESLEKELKKITSIIDKSKIIYIYYPSDYRISFEEYDLLKPLLKGKVSLMRMGA